MTGPVVRCRAVTCHRPLTDATSRLLGYGPTCARRLGVSYRAPKPAGPGPGPRRAATAHPVEVADAQMELALEEAS